MFGSKPQSTGGLFGGNSGTGFGSNSGGGAPSTGFSFGSNQTQNNAPGNAAGGASGGLFGKPAAPATGGGLFGSGNNTLASSGAPGSGGLFGSGSVTGTGTQNTTLGNAFGTTGSGTGNAGAATGGGGLFGASTANKPGGGLFGNTSNTAGTTTGGGLFGNAAQGTNNTSGGGLFGTTNTNAPSSTSTGLFGAKPATTGTSLFGGNQATASGGLFGGQPSQQQQQQQQFQQQQQPQQQLQQQQAQLQPSFGWNKPLALASTNTSLFNGAANNQNTNSLALTGITPASNSLAVVPKTGYAPTINDQLTKIIEDWDPTSAKCVFKSHLYNKLGENEMQILMNQPRPQNETAEDWDSAMRSRPSNLHYPIKITSFSEVATRVQVQIQHVAKSRTILTDINEKLQALSAKHELDNTTRILRAKAHHTRLSRRLLRLATVLAIVKLKGYPLLPEEEETSRQFEILNSKLSDPNSPLSKFTDLFARVMLLKERAEEFTNQFNDALTGMAEETQNGSKADENTKDEDDQTSALLNKLAKILMKQQMGLNYVNDVLSKDQEDLDKLLK